MKNEWEQILLTHAKIVFKYLIKIGATKEDAEDITQETIMKTIECLQQIQPKKIRAWMFKVAIHRYYSLYNKNKTIVQLNEVDLEKLMPAIEDVEFSLLTKEIASELDEALQELQPMFQQLLILKYYLDFSYKEISEILSIKETNVKTYLHRARNTLKKYGRSSLMENEKIDDLFDIKKMEKSIKKAKRRASWKSVFITVAVLIILIIVGTIANRNITYQLEGPIQISASGFYEISAPNEFIGKLERYHGILGGENRYTTYKIIEGKVVYTGDESYGYGLFRDENLNRIGIESPILIGDSYSEDDLQKQRYNELGQREMVFFYPFIQYDNYRNDINLLDDIGQEKVMEVALSFDKGYSFNEVKKMISEDVTLSWLWVDDVNGENVEDFHVPIRDKNNKIVDTNNLVRSENTVYGVSLFNANGDKQDEPVHNFILNIENGKKYKARWQGEYNRLFTTLGGEDEKLTEDDLQYFGAVVTGNPQNLSKLKNSPFIKASSIGVIIDQY